MRRVKASCTPIYGSAGGPPRSEAGGGPRRSTTNRWPLEAATGSCRAPDWIRTNDTRFRRAVLYPLSYEGLQRDTLPAPRPPSDGVPLLRHPARPAPRVRRRRRPRARGGAVDGCAGTRSGAGPRGADVATVDLVVLGPGRHDHDGAGRVGQDSLARGAEEEPGEPPAAARADDDEVDGGGELRHELGGVAVESVPAHRDARVPLGCLGDGAIEAGADVDEDLLAVDGGRQPREGAGAGGHGDGRDGGELGAPDVGLVDGPAKGLAGGLGAVDADDHAAHGRVVGALEVAWDDDRRAVGVRGQGGGDGAEKPVGEAAAASGADDGQSGLVGQVDEDAGGVAGLERARDGHAGALGPGDCRVDDGLGAGADRGVVERGVSAVEGGGREGGQRVRAQEVNAPSGAGGAGDRPVHRPEGLRRAVNSDEDDLVFSHGFCPFRDGVGSADGAITSPSVVASQPHVHRARRPSGATAAWRSPRSGAVREPAPSADVDVLRGAVDVSVAGVDAGVAGVDHLAVTDVDADVAAVVDDVAGLGLRGRDDGAGSALRVGGARQGDPALGVHPLDEAGAVPAARGGAAGDVGDALVLEGGRGDGGADGGAGVGRRAGGGLARGIRARGGRDRGGVLVGLGGPRGRRGGAVVGPVGLLVRLGGLLGGLVGGDLLSSLLLRVSLLLRSGTLDGDRVLRPR
ncbi:hypothetical protein CTheo_8215 [Ceratobasidium theobromae]|uniref:Uncharacterized protein n=1 Tax=Ceratobasidium theobromae TaxID=1582974 RepID=A0A5N5QAB7_9AGAM|nr:hypothetical protein CTheo_8215 [Ceratobasidium theobromae]